MTLISLDGSQFNDVDTLLLGALSLSAATGQPFEMKEVGKIASTPGVTPLHLTVMRALARLCGAEMKGEAVSAKTVRFTPKHAPQARDFVVDTGETTGRPLTAPVTPLMEALIPALAAADGDTLVRLRGVNASPFSPSAFWVRETLAPMLAWLGMEVAVEIEKWGWHPEGGGETTLVVEGGWLKTQARGSLVWEERGDLVGLWAVAALSPRLEERAGQQMVSTLQKELAREPFEAMQIEVRRVRSPGPGSGLFLALQFEQVTAGFEAVSHRGMSAEQVVQDATSVMSQYFWSDAALSAELGRALMIPLALTGQPASFTTNELTPAMRVLEYLIPQFLPVTVSLSKHPAGGQVQIQPNSST